MELKYYTKKGNTYLLINPAAKMQKIAFISVCIFSIVMIGFVHFADESNTDKGALTGVFLLILIPVAIIAFNATREVIIDPANQIVVVKKGRGKLKYAFDQFINFKKTQRKMYGVVTVDWWASVYFNDNKKNILIPLGHGGNEAIVDEIIAETYALLTLKTLES